MAVLNATGLTPFSLRTNRRPEPSKPLHCRPFKKPISDASPPNLKELLATGLGGGLAVLSSVLGAGGFAEALTYEEALGLGRSVSETSAPSADAAGFDVGGLFDGLLNFASENPLVIGGAALVLAVPLVLSQILKDPKAFGAATAGTAFLKLSEDEGAQLLDIREAKDVREGGSPDLRSIKKKVVSIVYKKDEKPGFLKKLALKLKDPGSTTLYILDKFDGNSELVAELVTANGFKAAFAIKDGAEGARGWKNSGLPWSSPKKALIDFGGLTDAITSPFGEDSGSLPATLGLAAATGLGIIAFSETETVLQLLGSAAIIQLVTKKLLFAEDRKVTLQLVDEFLNTKVAPKDLVDEIKMIGKALLPVSSSAVASLAAPAEVNTETSVSSEEVKTDAVPEITPEPKVEAAAAPLPAVNSVPKAEVTKESIPVTVRPLSPYPQYPDFKPPSSPTPSQA